MNNSYINIYQYDPSGVTGNPTGSGTDGKLVSENGDMTAPVDVTLNAANNESKTVKLALRCQSGYINTDNATVQTQNDSNNHWSLCLTADGTFDTVITVSGDFSVNSVFWAKASSNSTETPTVDESVKLKVTVPIVPA